VSITGDARAGYCRLASHKTYQIQLRWEPVASLEALQQGVRKYLSKLSKDQRGAQAKFEIEQHGATSLTYRFQGRSTSRGIALLHGERKLGVMAEVVSAKGENLASAHQRIASGVSIQSKELLVWEVLGLRAKVPKDLTLSKRNFLAGRTDLEFSRGRLPGLVASRWGLAFDLLAKHELPDWAKAALDLPRATVEEVEEGVLLRQQNRLSGERTAIVRVVPEDNKILAIRSKTGHATCQPRWEWLAF